jgi:hypothetical protein
MPPDETCKKRKLGIFVENAPGGDSLKLGVRIQIRSEKIPKRVFKQIEN